MNLKQHLVDGDPVARDPRMSDADVLAMRRAILVEARRQTDLATASWWPRPLPLAAALAACLALGVGIGMRLSDDSKSATSSRPVAPATRDVRRQLQITAPGGTRIIWTLHENLEL